LIPVKLIHNLSKEARFQIIEILLANRSNKELAIQLGISPSSITKYLNREMHPSDKVVEKCLTIADQNEREEIVEVILQDVIKPLTEFLESLDHRRVPEALVRLKKKLEGLDFKALGES
jgi:transcriptional regulator with XRE-family HTH domain